MSSNSSANQYMGILAEIAEEEYQDITAELDEFEVDEFVDEFPDTDTEDEDELSTLLEYAPAELEGVSGWIRSMEYGERQYWEQFVRDMHSYEAALVALGFTHEDVRGYLAKPEP